MPVLIETLILVPVRDNNGRGFPPSLWRDLQDRLLAFGGYTRRGGIAGAWPGAARVYHDQSRQYEVSLASWADFAAWFEVVRWVRTAFRQEAIYIKVAGIVEVFDAGEGG